MLLSDVVSLATVLARFVNHLGPPVICAFESSDLEVSTQSLYEFRLSIDIVS